jgi:hypothetical protein
MAAASMPYKDIIVPAPQGFNGIRHETITHSRVGIGFILTLCHYFVGDGSSLAVSIVLAEIGPNIQSIRWWHA